MPVRLIDEETAVVCRMIECADADREWKAKSWTVEKSWWVEKSVPQAYLELGATPSLQRFHSSSTNQHPLEMCLYHSQCTCES